jgi:hypothetical protein
MGDVGLEPTTSALKAQLSSPREHIEISISVGVCHGDIVVPTETTKDVGFRQARIALALGQALAECDALPDLLRRR